MVMTKRRMTAEYYRDVLDFEIDEDLVTHDFIMMGVGKNQ